MPVTLIPDRLPAFHPLMVPDPGIVSPPRPAAVPIVEPSSPPLVRVVGPTPAVEAPVSGAGLPAVHVPDTLVHAELDEGFAAEAPDLLDIAEVVSAAADVDAAVDDACRAHPALAEHLRIMFPARTLLPESAPRLSREPEPQEAPAATLAAGAQLGPFSLVRQLGHGATAQVWEAVDRRYDAPVALKLFFADRARSADLDRAMAEASAMSRITHDNVVFVREAGRIGDTWYIAMALYREAMLGEAEPRSARDLSRVEPRDVTEVITWGVQIARALAAAHAAGVFHQDLKPENVLCLPHSRSVRLGDFGLAPLNGEAGPRTSRRWNEPGLYCAGTPELMAPEQARGLDHVPDPVADRRWLVGVDVYGLGATLWTLCADEAPHAPPASNRHADVIASCTAPVPRLDAVPTRVKVSRRLADIVAKAMADDPDERHLSAEELADDLQALLDRRPTSIDATWSPVRAGLWVQRHPLRAQTVAMGLLALFGVQGAWMLGAEVEAKQAELVEAEARLGTLDAALTTTNAELDAARAQANAVSGALRSTQEALGQKTTDIATLNERYAATQATLSTAVLDARAGTEAEKLRGDTAEAGQRAAAEVLRSAIDTAAAEGRRASSEALRADLAEADRAAEAQRAASAEKKAAEVQAALEAAREEKKRLQAAIAAAAAAAAASATEPADEGSEEPENVRIVPAGR